VNRDKIIIEYLPLVKKIAMNISKKMPYYSFLKLDDLISEGNMALCKAVDSYDETKGTLFFWFNLKIRGAIINAIKISDPIFNNNKDIEKNKLYSVSYDAIASILDKDINWDILESSYDILYTMKSISKLMKNLLIDNVPDLNNNIDIERNKTKIIDAIQKLTMKQKRFIIDYYYNNLTYEQICNIRGLKSIKSLQNLHYKALNNLRNYLMNG
jgi:RNA polymerase sigma factor for flagellar operon FliA